MKPSEYFKNEIPARIKWYAEEFAKTNRVYEELDSRFIDKEELKEKIKKLIKKLEAKLYRLEGTDRAYHQGKIAQLKEILEIMSGCEISKRKGKIPTEPKFDVSTDYPFKTQCRQTSMRGD